MGVPYFPRKYSKDAMSKLLSIIYTELDRIDMGNTSQSKMCDGEL